MDSIESREQGVRDAACLLVSVQGNPLPVKPLDIRCESEAVEKVLTSNERHVPETRDARGIVLNRHFLQQLLQKLPPLPIFTQVFAERLEARQADCGANDKHWLALLAREDDFMRRANAVDVGRAVCDDEIAGVNHS